jgi:hypothetical protein
MLSANSTRQAVRAIAWGVVLNIKAFMWELVNDSRIRLYFKKRVDHWIYCSEHVIKWLLVIDFNWGLFCSILDESANSRKETNMGGLYDSVSGYGFPTKKKRSTMRDKNIHPHDRSLARFRRIPTFEDEDSD